MSKPKSISIDELEKLLNSEPDEDLEILPDGTIRKKGRRKRTKRKSLTMKEPMGGEYARAPDGGK